MQLINRPGISCTFSHSIYHYTVLVLLLPKWLTLSIFWTPVFQISASDRFSSPSTPTFQVFHPSKHWQFSNLNIQPEPLPWTWDLYINIANWMHKEHFKTNQTKLQISPCLNSVPQIRKIRVFLISANGNTLLPGAQVKLNKAFSSNSTSNPSANGVGSMFKTEVLPTTATPQLLAKLLWFMAYLLQ